MANAAAKKAKAAAKTASSTYLPIISIINVAYLFIRIIYHWETFNTSQLLLTSLLLVLTAFAYQGIVQDHIDKTSSVAFSSSKSTSSSDSHSSIAGGISLDLLGLVVVIQFGTALWSNRFFYLLIVIPIYGAWKLYNTFFSGSGGMLGGLFGGNSDAKDAVDCGKENVSEADEDKRKKRADKRRMKWS